jgi:KipI family sensor histidine kinase inhibitor
VELVHRVASAIESAAGHEDRGMHVVGVVVGLHTVVVLLDQPDGADRATASWVDEVAGRTARSPDGKSDGDDGRSGRVVDIPVDFDGPDLAEVAAAVGTDQAGVADLLTSVELEVAFLGFAPGFPYLTGLPAELATIRRRATPRASVPAGSVAVAGGFASVYPRSTPGGWMLIGTTTVPLFDPNHPPYALVGYGDKVQFRHHQATGAGGPRPASDWSARAGAGHVEARPPLRSHGGRWAEILDPGLLSLVQDRGRRGVAGVGVPGAGAADPDALVLANRLVGNADDAAVIELTAAGPTLRWFADAHVAVVGATSGAIDVELDGRPCPDSTVIPVGQGQLLTIGRVRSGLRGCLAVAGGFATPTLMGSQSSDLLSGLGLGRLVVGDQIELGSPARPHGVLVDAGPVTPSDRPREVRILAGPHEASRAWTALLEDRWSVAEASNRIGVRVAGGSGPLPPAPTVRGAASTGMVTGAIQLPPDGQPIILGPDHATVGGYPVIGCVISADLSAVGQLAPGDVVTFAEVDLAAARRAWEERARGLDGRVRGWFPTATGT